ncbi:hypothetical protein TDB9533_04241 [Thalassocella blandensis]|nr:hypothetical protein TDB9533_04241 [Thalassocella blandensis]
MTLEVIGVGFGRTGTMSLKVALEQLGYGPCYHMMDVMQGPSKIADSWLRVLHGEPPEWEKIFHGYRASVDWPALYFLPELLEKYPGIKVVLTERDAESWYQSAAGTIFRAIQTRQGNWVPKQQQLALELIIEKTFHNKADDKKTAKEIYEAHICWVKSTVPAKQLICFNVRDGWPSLCQSLNKPVPLNAFPQLNTSSDFNATFDEVVL